MGEAEIKVKELNSTVANRIWCPLYAGPCNSKCVCFRKATSYFDKSIVTNPLKIYA